MDEDVGGRKIGVGFGEISDRIELGVCDDICP